MKFESPPTGSIRNTACKIGSPSRPVRDDLAFHRRGDTAFANSGRNMASLIHGQTHNQAGSVLFEGHWGFQYYMQRFGARPVEYDKFAFQTGDVVVIPENTTSTFPIAPQFVASQQILQIDPHAHAATMALGAGFYSSVWGPLPFSFGRVPSEPYLVEHLRQPAK